MQTVDDKITAFQERVYSAITRIPAGRVATYGTIAKMVGCGSARAVGQALKRNPFAPKVPCHRVVSASRSPGGFFGETSEPAINKKCLLLKKEGVTFDSSGRVNKQHLLS